MLYGLLLTLYIFICLLMVLLILIQQGKGSMGLGSLGGSSQMLFGGSGGQDIFQKATWVLGFSFMFLSLVLSLMKTSQRDMSGYFKPKTVAQKTVPTQTPAA